MELIYEDIIRCKYSIFYDKAVFPQISVMTEDIGNNHCFKLFKSLKAAML